MPVSMLSCADSCPEAGVRTERWLGLACFRPAPHTWKGLVLNGLADTTVSCYVAAQNPPVYPDLQLWYVGADSSEPMFHTTIHSSHSLRRRLTPCLFPRQLHAIDGASNLSYLRPEVIHDGWARCTERSGVTNWRYILCTYYSSAARWTPSYLQDNSSDYTICVSEWADKKWAQAQARQNISWSEWIVDIVDSSAQAVAIM
jgi:hypothetical protein